MQPGCRFLELHKKFLECSCLHFPSCPHTNINRFSVQCSLKWHHCTSHNNSISITCLRYDGTSCQPGILSGHHWYTSLRDIMSMLWAHCQRIWTIVIDLLWFQTKKNSLFHYGVLYQPILLHTNEQRWECQIPSWFRQFAWIQFCIPGGVPIPHVP